MEPAPIGRYFEEFTVGEEIKHSLSKTIFESDNNFFCLLTMNNHPVHTNIDYASKNQHGKVLVVGTLVFSLAVGMTVPDISGKAIANLGYEDVKHLGEMGDVKNVANGYARNYLFPHMFAVPYNPETVAYFEGKKAEIEARKEQKRAESRSLKEKLEALTVELVMPAGSNGKLYGAVTNQTVADFYARNGYEVERKRIEIPGSTIKQTGTYSIKVHLYESTLAETKLVVKAQEAADTKAAPKAKKEEAAKPAETEAKAE